MISAKVIKDSIAPSGWRLTTVEATAPRFILPELNTHRMFSRNTSSSRAIPARKTIERVACDPALPHHWGANQHGMRADAEVDPESKERGLEIWLMARDNAVISASVLSDYGVHKQVVNRLLEPFLWTRTLITATHWDNFFHLRCSQNAQPEMRLLAESIKSAITGSNANRLRKGQWHIPFDEPDLPLSERLMVSAARCARISYLNHDGSSDVSSDLRLASRLAIDGHLSPFEHQAKALTTLDWEEEVSVIAEEWRRGIPAGNLCGWLQHRKIVEGTRS